MLRFAIAHVHASAAQSDTSLLGAVSAGAVIGGAVIGAEGLGANAALTSRVISGKRLCRNGPGHVWFENMLCLVKLPFGVPS